VTRVAATPAAAWVAGGLDDGRVWLCDLKDGGRQMLKAEKGAAISALALSSDGKRILWGDENGRAGLIEVTG
jgi:hypothetical protein